MDLLQGYPYLLELKEHYRARANLGNNLYKNVRDLWYPKPEHVTSLGRANEIGRPLFYRADSENTAFIEVAGALGESYTIMRCVLQDRERVPTVVELDVLRRVAVCAIRDRMPPSWKTMWGYDGRYGLLPILERCS